MPFLRSSPELLFAFRRGDRDALARVYWAYADDLTRIVRRKLGGARDGRGQQLADIVQEVFIRAFSERGRLAYDGMRDFAPYLATIARNLMIDEARKGGREVSIDGQTLETWTAEPADEPRWEDPATVQVVEAYLASLSAPLSQVHEQRYVHGLAQRDAAAKLGLSRQQLRTQETRLRDGLVEALRRASLLEE